MAFQCEEVGVREAQELGFASRRLQGPRCYGRLFAGKSRKVGSVWLWVQLDYDEELGLLHGMYGSMEAAFEVQRTIKRAELTAFCLLEKVIGPIKVHVDNKGIIDGLRRGERKMHQAKGGRCKFVDRDLGRIAPFGCERDCGRSGACQGTPHTERKEIDVAL